MAKDNEVNEEATVEAKAPVDKGSATVMPAKEIGTNPLKLPWPQDPTGAFSALRSGGVKAATRVKGDAAKLEKLMESLRIIAKHAQAKFDREVADRSKAREASISARARVSEKLKRQAEAKAVELEEAAKRTRVNAGLPVAGSEVSE